MVSKETWEVHGVGSISEVMLEGRLYRRIETVPAAQMVVGCLI